MGTMHSDITLKIVCFHKTGYKRSYRRETHFTGEDWGWFKYEFKNDRLQE